VLLVLLLLLVVLYSFHPGLGFSCCCSSTRGWALDRLLLLVVLLLMLGHHLSVLGPGDILIFLFVLLLLPFLPHPLPDPLLLQMDELGSSCSSGALT
jgi:hypothetical protein